MEVKALETVVDASAVVTATEVDASLSSSGEEDLKKPEFKSRSCY